MEVSLSYTNYCLNLLPSNPNNLYGWNLFLEASYSIICIDQMQGESLEKKENDLPRYWDSISVPVAWRACDCHLVGKRDRVGDTCCDLYICGTVQISSGHPWPLRCALSSIFPVGFEPTIYRLEVCCIIQLCYRNKYRRWDLNPYWTDFKSVASANWATAVKIGRPSYAPNSTPQSTQ